MRDASDRPARDVSVCERCETATVTAVEGLFRNPHPGTPRRFRSPTCRQAAYRRRLAGVAEATPTQPKGGRPRRLNNTKEVTPLAN
jgi:hypothetical protein